MTEDSDRIRQAIAALETQRATLGDQVTDAAIAPLRAALEGAREVEYDATKGRKSISPPTQPHPQLAQDQDERRDQRKQVTILFADVSGFTALSEALDAEVVRDLINSLWERLDASLAAHGGYIDKHIGDAMMAVFGVPVSREDDAVRAVRAALALQAELASFAAANVRRREDGRPGLAMRVGLHTGPAVVGEVGTTAEYTAIGDTVNTASRLEGLAPVGGVLISETTLDQVHGLFETRRMEPVKVKGKADPVHTALVLGAKERSFRDPRRGRTYTPLVGRDQELARLLAIVQDASSSAHHAGRAVRAVLVTGEAGIGKSRLLRELDDRLLAQDEPPRVLRGRAEQVDRDRPYALVRAALRDLWGAGPNSGALPDPAEEAALSYVLGLSEMSIDSAGMDNAQHERERTWSVLVRAMEGAPTASSPGSTGSAAASQAGRLVFLAEDLHWADPTSLAFLEFLARRWSRGALVIVATSRTAPDANDQAPPWEEMTLGRLDDSAARVLAAAVLGPRATKEWLDDVGERGAGNPYFVEELARLVHDSTMSRLPGTLTALLQARLDTLEPERRRVAESAAVAGAAFWDRAAEAANAARPERQVEVSLLLGSLADAAILDRKPESDLRVPSAAAGDEPGGEEVRAWAFRHVLFHDVVYESVLLRERRPMHRAVAEWLVTNSAARRDLSAEVADHLERSDAPALAAPWRLRTARQALAAYANEEALSQADRGIAVSDERATTFDLRDCRRQALGRLGRRDEEAAEVRALVEAAVALGPEGQARAALAEADLAWSTADYAAATEAAARALTLAQSDGSRALEAASLKELGRAARETGDLEQATRMFERAESAFARAGDSTGRANALVQLGTVAAHRGDARTATQFLTLALDVARQAGDVWDEAWALDNLAIIQFESGQLDLAVQAARESLALAIRGGLLFREALSRANLAGMLLMTGRSAEAAEEAEMALELSGRIGDEYGAVLAQVTLGEARLAKDELAGQLDLTNAHRRAHKLGAPFPSSVAARALATWLLVRPWAPLPRVGEPARALRLARESARLAVRAGDPAGTALSHALETLALAQSGASGVSVERAAKRAVRALSDAPDDGSAILVLATLGAAMTADSAAHYRAAAAELTRRAAVIGDRATRRSFARGVQPHRWLLERDRQGWQP